MVGVSLAGYAYATGIALAVFASSGVVASIVAKIRGRSSPGLLEGLSMEISIAVFSVAGAFLLTGGVGIVGASTPPISAVLQGAVAAAALAVGIYAYERSAGGPGYMPVELEGLWQHAVLLLFAAPIGEELLFRGLVEGYLLSVGETIVAATVFTALLFSLMHTAPYRDASPRDRVAVLVVAFIVGLVAGYYRAVAGSVWVSVAIHSAANLGGVVGGGIMGAGAS